GNSHKTPNDALNRRAAIANPHVEIESLFPHWNEKYRVTRLTEVLLRNLQFDRFARFVQRAEQRRGRLANLKIDRTIFDLNDDVVIEAAIEIVEIIVGGAGAIVFGILPIHVMVVHKTAIKDHAAMRLQRSCNDIGGVRMSAAIRRGSDTAFGV